MRLRSDIEAIDRPTVLYILYIMLVSLLGMLLHTEVSLSIQTLPKW